MREGHELEQRPEDLEVAGAGFDCKDRTDARLLRPVTLPGYFLNLGNGSISAKQTVVEKNPVSPNHKSAIQGSLSRFCCTTQKIGFSSADASTNTRVGTGPVYSGSPFYG